VEYLEMPAGYLKLKKKYGTVKAAKIWNSKMKGTGKTVGKGRS
jgi:hypothetical protein